MDIVIISEFCGDFSESDNDRFFYIAKMLSDSNQVELITSSFQHTKKRQRDEKTFQLPFNIKLIYEPGYPRNVCLQRFHSHYVWGRNLLKYIKKRKKPDVIYFAIPSLTGPNLIAKYCEKNNIRFVIDLQDLWPEAFQMIVNIPVISSIAFAPFKQLADGIYKRADAICAVSSTYCQRAAKVNRKVKETVTVFLGTELKTFDKYAAIRESNNAKGNEIWLAYCGTLGSSYDLTCVIDALNLLNNSKLKLVVMGDGPRKEEFEKYSKKKGVNALFTGRLKYSEMCSLLSECDITVNPITHMAAQSIINKHADYAASGLPVVSTQECKEYRDLVEEYNMGFNCNNNDSVDLAEKIRVLVDNRELRHDMGINARRCAKERFDRETTYKLIEKLMVNGGRKEY